MTTTTIDMPEREAWLKFREAYWNASDTAALFGDHPYCTTADVAVRKLTGKRPAENAQMYRGRRLEAAVAEWWSDEHGIAVYPADRLFLHDELVLATPDYLIVGVDDECLEVKTTAHTVIEPERYWWWQVQAQCLAGDLRRVHLAVLDRSMDLQTFVVERDDEACTQIAERAAIFMEAIRAEQMPDDVTLAYDHHLALHPTSHRRQRRARRARPATRAPARHGARPHAPGQRRGGTCPLRVGGSSRRRRRRHDQGCLRRDMAHPAAQRPRHRRPPSSASRHRRTLHDDDQLPRDAHQGSTVMNRTTDLGACDD